MSLFFTSSLKKASQKCKSPKPSRKSSIDDAKNCRIYISRECAETVYELHKKLGHRSVGETIRWLLAQIKPTVRFILCAGDRPRRMATLDSLNNAPLMVQQMQGDHPLPMATLDFWNNSPLIGQQMSETLPFIHGGPSFDQLLNENNNVLSFPPLFDDATILPSIFNVDETSPTTPKFGFSNNNLSLPPIHNFDAREGRFSTSMSVFTAGETLPPSFDAKSFHLENGFAFSYNSNNVSLVPSDATLPGFGTAGETSMSADATSFHMGK